MGCGASVPAPATKEQKEKMCGIACKLMMVACVEHVINTEIIANKSKDICIDPPPEAQQLQAISKECRSAAAEAKGKMAEAGADMKSGADGAGVAVAGAAAGMFGMGAAAALGSAASAVAGAAAAAGGMAAAGAGAAIEVGFTLVADGLDTAIGPVEKDFNEVAQQLVENKKADILKVYNETIHGAVFSSALTLVRGQAPHGPKEYEAAPTNAVTNGFSQASADKLATALSGAAVGDFVKESKAVKAWKSAIEKYNAANEKLGEINATLKGKPIELDIEVYIVKQVIEKLTTMMAAQEALIRKAPAGKSKQRAQTFELCYSGEEINIKHYQEFEKMEDGGPLKKTS
eukprot:TRINITY_DN18545_c0_g1_i1.p1 TRINITY_DN18545_c0_g1~~TRINITY_DN18545_c0_g1_i1.p1  ORF type:complete len:346 (-),score=140.27 TRINITY_DN18545_c0_g1_i1:186-1223(-)